MPYTGIIWFKDIIIVSVNMIICWGKQTEPINWKVNADGYFNKYTLKSLLKVSSELDMIKTWYLALK